MRIRAWGFEAIHCGSCEAEGSWHGGHMGLAECRSPVLLLPNEVWPLGSSEALPDMCSAPLWICC